MDGVTTAAHFAVELVIQTASGVLTGRYGPKEAVTLLASQGRRPGPGHGDGDP